MSNCIPDKIIGLSTTECPCFDTDKPTDYNESLSGYFIDDHISIEDVSGASDCEKGSIWDILEKARVRAIDKFSMDISLGLMKTHNERFPRSSNFFGRKSFKSDLSIADDYAAFKIETKQLKGGCLTLSEIHTAFNSTGTIDVSLYDNIDENPIEVYTLNTTANKLTKNVLPSPIELPTYVEGCDEINYYLVYDANSFVPKDNDIQCTSCEKRKLATLNKFGDIDGVTGNDLTDIDNWKSNGYANGLHVKIEFKCKTNTLLCDRDFDNCDVFDKAIAQSINWCAAHLATIEILTSKKPSFLNLTCREELGQDAMRFKSEYEASISDVLALWDFKDNDCLVCKQRSGAKRVSLM